MSLIEAEDVCEAMPAESPIFLRRKAAAQYVRKHWGVDCSVVMINAPDPYVLFETPLKGDVKDAQNWAEAH